MRRTKKSDTERRLRGFARTGLVLEFGLGWAGLGWAGIVVLYSYHTYTHTTQPTTESARRTPILHCRQMTDRETERSGASAPHVGGIYTNRHSTRTPLAHIRRRRLLIHPPHPT